ncbi:acyl-CoA dehydrogenase family protein [Pseudomonas asiatica]|uniref:acyl-CoA dehydrogenase family protein n=1 Tax=Pseudomonas asiatica TaxID=2219225 RepID=UPI002E7B0283|nr:acyl-CoA dehydrogenase family protein [Pseudomonas asiatica]MEE1916301.1 acyl-CoA dehydrogenase family protein [Pseudomonas asiatica]
MNFDFSADQEQLRDQAQRVFANSLASARSLLESTATHDQALWRSIVELGWPAAGIAEEDGGLGLSALEWCVLAEEAGRTLAPIPFASSVQHASMALQQALGCADSKSLLGALAAGELIATVAFNERGQRSWVELPTARVTAGRLTGIKVMVADAPLADVFIVSALDDQNRAGWWQVQARTDGVSLVASESVDRIRRHADVHFANALATPLAAGQDWHVLSERALDASAVLTAFEQLGAAQACLALTLEYVKTRKAFNRPIGGYQAVKHTLADVYVKNQLARSHCYYGAWALTQAPGQLPRAAAGARLAASDALNVAAEAAVELFGGIGFTWESDTQLFYRRARLLATQLGGRALWARRLVAALAREQLEETH